MRAARVFSVHARRRAATLQLGPAGKSAYSLAKLALTEEEIKSIRVLRRGCATGAQRLARDRDQAFYILFPCPRLFHTVFFGAPICAPKDCATARFDATPSEVTHERPCSQARSTVATCSLTSRRAPRRSAERASNSS